MSGIHMAFLGGGEALVDLPASGSVNTSALTFGSPSSITVELTSGGLFRTVHPTGVIDSVQFVTPPSATNRYEVRATYTGTLLSAGSLNTWLPLSSTEVWTLERSTAGVASGNLTLEVRNAASLLVRDTETYFLSAEYA